MTTVIQNNWVFFISEQNCCFGLNFLNRSSDFLSTKSQTDGTSNRTGKSTDKENSNDRSETDERKRNRSMDAAESAFSQGGQLLFERRRGDDRKINKRDNTNRKKAQISFQLKNLLQKERN